MCMCVRLWRDNYYLKRNILNFTEKEYIEHIQVSLQSEKILIVLCTVMNFNFKVILKEKRLLHTYV